jgi:hypothetical protein
MRYVAWALPLVLMTGCAYHLRGNTNQIQLAIYTPLCVDVLDASTTSGADLQVYPCGPGKRSQEWTVVPIDEQTHVELVNENSKMCMAVLDANDMAPGQLVIQEPCADNGTQQNQLWNIVLAPPGMSGTRIVSLASGQCLDLPYGAAASVFHLQQYYCTADDPAQGWVLNSVPPGDEQ